MKKAATMGLSSLTIGVLVWGCYFFLEAHPSILIDDRVQTMTNALRHQFKLIGYFYWGMWLLSLGGLILGILDWSRHKPDNHKSLAVTILGCFLSGSFVLWAVFLIFYAD